MKIYKTIIILTIILLAFISCDVATNDAVTPPQSNEDCLVFGGEVLYSVVRSDISSRAVTDAAVALRKFMQESSSGSEVKILTDWVKKGEDIAEIREEYEILIGTTNRPESIESYEKFRSTDEPLEYMIEKSGNHYIILANDDVIMQAVEAFIENITVYAEENTLKVTKDINVTATKQFPVSLLKIDDANIKDFKIVYPSSYNGSQSELAENVKQYIFLATGYEIEVISDSASKGNHEIIIGTARNTSHTSLSDLDCVIEIRDGNLYIGGNNYYADAKAVNYLINDILYYNMYGKNPTKIELTSSDSKIYTSKPYNYDIIA
jgi:hypothetical protein